MPDVEAARARHAPSICPRVWHIRFGISLLLISGGSIGGPWGAAAAPSALPALSPNVLVLSSVGRAGRSPLHRDAVEALIVTGRWSSPKAGDVVTVADGNSRRWTPMSAEAAADGSLTVSAPPGGYVWMTVEASAPRIVLLEASGHSLVYVNGEPRVGDPYNTGWVRLPILLHPGVNGLLFQGGRGKIKAHLAAPRAPALLDTRDATLPDRVVGEREPVLGAVVVINATSHALTALSLRAAGSGAATVTRVPAIPPLGTRKVAFRWSGPVSSAQGTTQIALALIEAGSPSRRLDDAQIPLRVRRPTETRKRTFISDIDGSVQYYAVNPARPDGPGAPRPALFLTLHGAGVEAIGQADAYESKSWGDLVAPTNRRPYGFDWEDWGRLDALEVLALARQRLRPDPERIYLTGHSMGGHGTWQLGATFPGQFAAIGPSAGWISFASYAGGTRSEGATPMDEMLRRAALPSDTLALAHNYAQEGVYILHGGADDNVPVEQARTMSRELAAFHHDFVFFEQPGAGHWWDVSTEPGADCVDWAPMFDFFARHALPDDESVRQVEFATADPGVSAWCHWAGIEAQTHPLQLSSISLRCDTGQRRFTGATTNVARLSLRLTALPAAGPVNLDIDGQKLESIPFPSDRQIWLLRDGGRWRVIPRPSPALKGPERSGPFKQAFRHRMLFVYGTRGTPEENAWALAKARYDAETFWYRGNGAVDLVADTAFDASMDRDRSVILYGNAQTNGAWNSLLAESPVQVNRDAVRIGNREIAGSDLACMFVRPRPGSSHSLVAVVGGAGPIGMRLTDRMPYFLSGVEYPDLLVAGPEVLERGSAGVRVAGFFGTDWGVGTGELAWQTGQR
jgi:dienelactone hydrolase